jgi:ADP-ribosylglycohydrolase
VGEAPHIFGLGRVFEMCADAIGSDFQIVHTLEEAYAIVEDSPENFNECVLVEELA